MIYEAMLFLSSLVFGLLAMLFGMSVAPFFLPFFLVIVGFPLSAAIGGTLVVKVFVFTTGLLGFVKHGHISYRLAGQILLLGIPAVIVGVMVSTFISTNVALGLMGLMLLIFAGLIIHPEHELLFRREDTPSKGFVRSEYGIAHNLEIVTSTLGGLLTGLIGSGAGEINNYVFLKKYRMPGFLAAGTSTFIVAILAVVAVLGHGVVIFKLENGLLMQFLATLAWVVPGAALGAALGSWFTSRIPDSLRELFVAALFLAIAVLIVIAALSI